MTLEHAKSCEAQGLWFEILGLSPWTPAAAVKDACRAARARNHPDRNRDVDLGLAQITNQAADRVTRLVLEPLGIWGAHFSEPAPAWAAALEDDLGRARRMRDSAAFERAFSIYRGRVEEEGRKRDDEQRRAEETDRALKRECAAISRDIRRQTRRFRRQVASTTRPPRGDAALAQARRARKMLFKKQRRSKRPTTDADREERRAADEQIAAAAAEVRRRRAEERVNFAVGNERFPTITRRLAETSPETAARIREITREYRKASKRHRPDESQGQRRERLEGMLREAWAAVAATTAETATAAREGCGTTA
jgi:hypothetical protein